MEVSAKGTGVFGQGMGTASSPAEHPALPRAPRTVPGGCKAGRQQ